MKVVDFLRPDLVLGDLMASSKQGAISEIARFLAERQPGVDPGELRRVLEEREAVCSTGIGDGIAIPHGKLDAVPQLVGCLARSVGGLDFAAIDGKPAHLVFTLVAPASSTGVHLKALARLSRLFRDTAFRQRLLGASDAAAMYAVVADEDGKY